jgi:hypothetical protein
MDNTAIEAGIRWYGGLLDIFTFAVVIGLFLEYRNEVADLWSNIRRHNWRWVRRDLIHVIGPILVVAGVAGELYAQFHGSILLSQYEAKSDQEVAALQNGTSKINERAANAEKKAADALLKQEELKSDNLTLARELQPRSVNVVRDEHGNISGGLDKFVTTPVLIQTVPDWEAEKLAAELFAVLTNFGWSAQYTDESVTHVSSLAIRDGVSIFTVRDESALIRNPVHPATETERWTALGAEALTRYLEAFHIDTQHLAFKMFGPNGVIPNSPPPPFPLGYSAPDNEVIVLIGGNPSWSAAVLSSNFPDTDELRYLQRDGPLGFGW